jgi:hypothetical protein
MLIEARDVADSVGLPDMYAAQCGSTSYALVALDSERLGVTISNGIGAPVMLDLSEPQTAFGVAMKLDEWEDSAPNGEGHKWRRIITAYSGSLGLEAGRKRLALMANRIRHIAMDHRIRRSLGWPVEPGTLATLHRGKRPRVHWRMKYGVDSWGPLWARGTDPMLALEAIHAEVTR